MKMGFVTQIKPGTYHGTFAAVTRSLHQDYGEGARWDFRIDQGESGGAIVSRTTKDVASKKNTCGQFWKMVSGLSFEAAIKHDTDEWLGVPGAIVVEKAPSGDSVRVVKFTRDDAK